MAILAKKTDLKIDGKTFDRDYTFSDIRLVQELQKPNEFRFNMHKRNLIEDENYIRFSLSEKLVGKEIEFSLTVIVENNEGKKTESILEFLGIIFSVNIVRKDLKAGAVVEVIARSPDYLLYDNPHCFSYENETIKNVVTKTLEPYSDKITVENDPWLENFEMPYCVQYNETNYNFLSRLASRFGDWFYYSGKELVFGKVKKLDPLTLSLGGDILNYQYSLDMGHLNFTHAQHEYLAYENAKKEGYEADKINESMHNLTDIVYDISKSQYKKATFMHLPEGAEGTAGEPQLSTTVQSFGKKGQMMICKGSGNRADLRIGSVIQITEGYEKEDGKSAFCRHDDLLIYKITHLADGKGYYENSFEAIPATCKWPPYTYNAPYPKAGTQRAVVVDNNDPEKTGRVRVQFLWQKEQDENMKTPWIRIATPHAGDAKGFYFIPELGEEVMVGFENGNAEKPYVIGALWHGKQRPSEVLYREDNARKFIKTRNHCIQIYDGEGDDHGVLAISDRGCSYLLALSSTEESITLKTWKGNIVLDAAGDIILKSQSNVKIQAGGSLSMNAGGNIDETAGNNITIGAGENMAINAANNMDRSVGKNDTLYVNQNQTIQIGENKQETVISKYEVSADIIREEAKNILQLYGKEIEERADSSIKVDGGKTLDLYAGNIRIK